MWGNFKGAYKTTGGQSSCTTRPGPGLRGGGLGLSQLFHISQGVSSTPGVGEGEMGGGQPIDLKQDHQFTETSEEKGRSGKYGSKINLGQGPEEFREAV